jgi:hypothetical protein
MTNFELLKYKLYVSEVQFALKEIQNQVSDHVKQVLNELENPQDENNGERLYTLEMAMMLEGLKEIVNQNYL